MRQQQPNRRTPEEKAMALEKVKAIIPKVEELELTAYIIAKHTSLSHQGITKIITRKAKFPKIENLEEIESFIRDYEEHKKNNPESTEPMPKQTPGNQNLEQKVDQILKSLARIEKGLEVYTLRQEIMIEIIKNAKGEEYKFLAEQIDEKIFKK